jgi:hypothetical protein
VGIVLAAFVVAVPTGLVAATLVEVENPTDVVVEGMFWLLLEGAWPVVGGAWWLEAHGGWKDLERPVEIGWVWGAITLLFSLGMEAEVIEAGHRLLQVLVALDMGIAVLLVLLVAVWAAGRPVARKGKEGQKGILPFQPAWSTSWYPGEPSRPTF